MSITLKVLACFCDMQDFKLIAGLLRHYHYVDTDLIFLEKLFIYGLAVLLLTTSVSMFFFILICIAIPVRFICMCVSEWVNTHMHVHICRDLFLNINETSANWCCTRNSWVNYLSINTHSLPFLFLGLKSEFLPQK